MTPQGQRQANLESATTFDVCRYRQDFPALHQLVYGKPLVYLDNAASAQKPRVVIDTITKYYSTLYSNVHRGLHYLSEQCTAAFEQARETARRFLNARESREIVFVRGTTEGINLVAFSYGRTKLRPGDEVLVTAMEHHSNIVPWQMICELTGARLAVAPIDERGVLIVDEFKRLLSERTKIVAITHVSNALGTINPVRELVALAHEAGARVLVDGAQAAPHMPVDVQELDCDFYVFSGHKVFGPTGIGILYGKAELLEAMPPYQGGGEMILSVTFEKTIYKGIPYKFEAGTPHIVGAIGLGAALEYLMEIGLQRICEYERSLLEYATQTLSQLPGVRLIGTAPDKAAVLSFVVDGVHPHDVGTILDREGIAVRAGHHCAQPVMEFFGVPATTRASFAFYNTREEVDALAQGIQKVQRIFSR